MNNILYNLLHKASIISSNIAEYFNDKFEAEYNRREAIAEAEYNKLVIDFYENGVGYYSKR